ncbi:hypothetical protein ACL7TT_02320 [Microbulbifer sp. 2304DJ12-6]
MTIFKQHQTLQWQFGEIGRKRGQRDLAQVNTVCAHKKKNPVETLDWPVGVATGKTAAIRHRNAAWGETDTSANGLLNAPPSAGPEQNWPASPH